MNSISSKGDILPASLLGCGVQSPYFMQAFHQPVTGHTAHIMLLVRSTGFLHVLGSFYISILQVSSALGSLSTKGFLSVTVSFHPSLACQQANIIQEGHKLVIACSPSPICAVKAICQYFLVAHPQGPLFLFPSH